MPDSKKPFWESKSLEEMSKKEWESLCDGCGLCCLNKIEYEDTQEIFHTKLACKLLDIGSCQCTDYKNRRKEVPDCIQLTPSTVREMDYLPPSCAYRLLAEGKKLKWWHHLISESRQTVHDAGISVQNRVLPEDERLDLEDYIIDWIKPVKGVKLARKKAKRKKKVK